MPLVAAERTVGPITLLELGPRLTAPVVGEFRDILGRLLAAGRKQVLLDCRQVEQVDSLGLGALTRAAVSLGQQGGKLGLVHPSACLQEALELTRLVKVMICFDELGDALRSF